MKGLLPNLLLVLALPVFASAQMLSTRGALSAQGFGMMLNKSYSTLIAHTLMTGDGNFTTSAINTTGATLIVIAKCTLNGAPAEPTSSPSNTWTALSAYSDGTASLTIYYAYAPATSSSQTFSQSDGTYDAMTVLAFNNTLTTSSVIGTSTGSGNSNGPSFQPGSITPTQVGELIVTFGCSSDSTATAISINSGFAIGDSIAQDNDAAPEDMASGYWTASNLNPVNPTWTFTGDTHWASAIASFKHP